MTLTYYCNHIQHKTRQKQQLKSSTKSDCTELSPRRENKNLTSHSFWNHICSHRTVTPQVQVQPWLQKQQKTVITTQLI